MLSDTQIFVALILALVSLVLAIRLDDLEESESANKLPRKQRMLRNNFPNSL